MVGFEESGGFVQPCSIGLLESEMNTLHGSRYVFRATQLRQFSSDFFVEAERFEGKRNERRRRRMERIQISGVTA